MVEEIIEEITTTEPATPVAETPEEVPASADTEVEPTVVVDETITTA